MNNVIPPTLHRRRVTLELTERLCSQKRVQDGINDLLKFSHSQDSEFQRYGRKIIALTEVARSTLTRMGVKLYLFITCSQTLLPLKSAYFKMLILIRHRKYAFPLELDDRVNRLLLPLYTHLAIRYGGVDTARTQLGIKELLVAPNAPAAGKMTCPPAAAILSVTKPNVAEAMPPPDSIAKKRARINRLGEFIKQQPTRESHARKHLVPKQYPAGDPGDNWARPLVPKEYPAANIQSGDNEEPSRSRRVFTRTNAQYFGIFCTGKRPVASARTVCID
ncbi:uncharacterized protein F5891DRAFT_737666 [Suillus fuscotomentosus]|uniref:Uncharacterized protein n=1 Tax=Suillus fuscotomentosus TaxID=1912939 RepID=A0AAD4HF82_9AGAM|nr:uncharacterized protein F5891DRAFT_737666 [Suillus fuscotomentosus]KAG1893996.1 hypothetical protein F5891DRAFT_737666 [Suillus fuscotomentosus]